MWPSEFRRCIDHSGSSRNCSLFHLAPHVYVSGVLKSQSVTVIPGCNWIMLHVLVSAHSRMVNHVRRGRWSRRLRGNKSTVQAEICCCLEARIHMWYPSMPKPARPGVSHVSGGCTCVLILSWSGKWGGVRHAQTTGLPFDDMANSSSWRPDVSRL